MLWLIWTNWTGLDENLDNKQTHHKAVKRLANTLDWTIENMNLLKKEKNILKILNKLTWELPIELSWVLSTTTQNSMMRCHWFDRIKFCCLLTIYNGHNVCWLLLLSPLAHEHQKHFIHHGQVVLAIRDLHLPKVPSKWFVSRLNTQCADNVHVRHPNKFSAR